MSEEGALPPGFRAKLAGEASTDPAEILAQKLQDASHQHVAVAHKAGTFFVTVPNNFSRQEFLKIGFNGQDTDRIIREDTANSWVVTGTSDATALGAANIWPEAGFVEAKGFGRAMVQQKKALGYCVIEDIMPGTRPPIPRGRDISIIPVTPDQTVLVLSERLVKESLPDIFPQKAIAG